VHHQLFLIIDELESFFQEDLQVPLLVCLIHFERVTEQLDLLNCLNPELEFGQLLAQVLIRLQKQR